MKVDSRCSWISLLAIVALLVSPEAWVGTYSSYAKFFSGFAITVPINIGSHSDHSGEGKALADQRDAYQNLLEGDDDRIQALYLHFTRGKHHYKRHHGMLKMEHRKWAGPEEMWASELTTQGVAIPFHWIHPPKSAVVRPVAQPQLPAPLEEFSFPEMIFYELYLNKKRMTSEDYHRASVISAQFLASQITPGGVLAKLPAVSGAHAPKEIESRVKDFAEQGELFSITRLLLFAREESTGIRALADQGKSPSARALAVILRCWLDQRRLTPEELLLVRNATGRGLEFAREALLLDEDALQFDRQ